MAACLVVSVESGLAGARNKWDIPQGCCSKCSSSIIHYDRCDRVTARLHVHDTQCRRRRQQVVSVVRTSWGGPPGLLARALMAPATGGAVEPPALGPAISQGLMMQRGTSTLQP